VVLGLATVTGTTVARLTDDNDLPACYKIVGLRC
jgi:hypothetical protein